MSIDATRPMQLTQLC